LSITDKNKCVYANEFTISIPKLEPMKFFSPNNDNLNDLWLVHGIETAPNAYIRIYDRHSKLLYQCKGSEFQGWDGKYETKDMVQDDYWYVISVPETEETLSGHFTLKR
jgi:gliding motility-associated-like protein